MFKREDGSNYLKLEHNINLPILMFCVVLHYVVIYYNVAKISLRLCTYDFTSAMPIV